MMNANMKAIVAKGYGGPEVLELSTVERPKPQANHVLVEVHSTTVTRADTMMRTGKPYFGRLILGITKPKYPIPGTGFAGVVKAIGSQVTKFKPGNRVFGETDISFSANAEFICLAEDAVISPLPEEISYNDASTFSDGFLTSFNFLTDIGGLQAGQKILINGGSGSLGLAAIQIAKALDAEVYAVASARNAGLMSAMGADHVIDYTTQDVYARSERFDLIFDTVGKLRPAKAKKLLCQEGMFLSPVLKPDVLFHQLLSIGSKGKRFRFAATGMKKHHELLPMLGELISLYTKGKLKVQIDRQYPLEKVAEAHRYVDTGRKKGNVVINVKHAQ